MALSKTNDEILAALRNVDAHKIDETLQIWKFDMGGSGITEYDLQRIAEAIRNNPEWMRQLFPEGIKRARAKLELLLL